jgi:hypothetical protein
LNPGSKLPSRLCVWLSGRQRIRAIPEFRVSILVLMALFVLSGCSTRLGYVPYDVYAGCFWPRKCAGNTADSKPPTYSDVKNWALQVADGYDTRSTFNRRAIYGGALIAAASTSALVGLAAFNTGGGVITALPIGATFLGGTMAIYNNEQKAVIYGCASQTIRNVLIQSDYKQANGNWQEGSQTAAICLHAQVSEVIRKVNSHITLLDPKNVADQLKGVAASVQNKQTAAANKQADAQAAQKKAQVAQVQADAAQRVANKAPEADQQMAQQTADTDKKLAAEANSEAINATNEASTAAADAKRAQDENTVVSVAAAANDFSDLQRLPDLNDMPELKTFCFPKADEELPAPSGSPSAAPMPGAC